MIDWLCDPIEELSPNDIKLIVVAIEAGLSLKFWIMIAQVLVMTYIVRCMLVPLVLPNMM